MRAIYNKKCCFFRLFCSLVEKNVYICTMNRYLLTFLTSILVLSVCNARHYDLTSRHISTADGLPSNIVIRIWQDEAGYMWFETRNGICRYDGYEIVRTEAVRPPDSLWNTLRTHDAVWQREGQGRLARHGKDGSIHSWQLIPHDIISYTRNDHFHVADVDERTEAITTYGSGLYLYDKLTGELTHIQKNDPHGVLGDNYLTGLFVDRTGCIWVIEDYIGINCLRLNNLPYTPLWLVPDAKIQDVNYIRCIAPFGEGRLLVSNQTGDTYIYREGGGQFSFRKNEGHRVYKALVDRSGHEWIGTRGNGLWCDGRQVSGLPSKLIFNIREDAGGRIIVSMLDGGVAVLSGSRKDILLAGRKVHDAQSDNNGQLWVVAEEGLFLFNRKGVVTDSLSGCFICLLADGNGTFWAGTSNRGLFRLTANNGKLVSKSYTKANGLASDGINSLVCDRLGRLWVGTEEGLSMLDARRGNIANYRISESSLSNVFCERAAVCLEDGRLLFGTHNGIISLVPPEDTAPITSRTAVTGLLANGILTGDSTLSYQQNNLTFRFSNFLYSHLQNVVYRYRLDGVDKEWNQATVDNSVTYRGLVPGRYFFRVCSSSGGDVWGEEAVIAVTIRHPWWNTWWAWLLYVLIFAVVAVAVWRISRRIISLHRQIDVERRVSVFQKDFYDRIERELRNPVNVLQGATENVQVSGTSKTTVQSLRRGSKRMLRLMDMIRQFHKLSDVEMQVKSETDAMNEETEQRFRQIVSGIHAEEAEYREMAPPPINSNLTLLIIEDDEDNLTHLTDTLNPYFHILGHQQMEECEDMVAIHSPSLIIIDISEKEKGACELTRRMHDVYPSLPIIHLSSYNDDTYQLRSLRSGAIDYLVKPFSGKVLLERVRKALEIPLATPNNVGEVETREVLIDVKDKKFLDRMNTTLSAHVGDENFSVEEWASLMNLGRTQFYKKVKELTGQTPVQHLHRARLDYAARLLRETNSTIEEVMLRAGYHNATHFYNSFKKRFGMSPKSYRG